MRRLSSLVILFALMLPLLACAPASTAPASGGDATTAAAPGCGPCGSWIEVQPGPSTGCLILEASPTCISPNPCGDYEWGYKPTKDGAVLGFSPVTPDWKRVRACGRDGTYKVHVVSSCGCAKSTIEVAAAAPDEVIP